MHRQNVLPRLMSYAGRYKFLTYSSWFLSAVSSFIALIPFWCIWRLVEEIIFSSENHDLARWGWLAVRFAVLSMLVYIAGLMCSHLAAFRIASNMRIKLLHHISSLPLGIVERFGSGHLRRIVFETSGAAETYLAHQLPDKYGAVAAALGLMVLLLSIDWRLGILSLMPVVIGFVILARMTGRSMQEKMSEYQDALSRMSNEAVEYVRGIPVVKTFGQTVFSFKRFQETIQSYEYWTTSYTKELRLPMVFYTLAVNSIFIFLILIGLFTAYSGMDKNFLINLILTIIAAPLISTALTRTMRHSEQELAAADALRRIDEIFALSPLAVEGEKCLNANADNISVELRNVSFSYDENQKALSKISFSLKPGETVALVGPSGGGKTTVSRLIARFFDPQEGTVLIDGADVKTIPIDDLMNKISFVFQDSRLIKGSILENVRLSRPHAEREEVMRALEAAQCMDIIEKFPDGIDTVIGTGAASVHLSGGEAQRIAIARAVLKNAPVIILDEATAFTDPDNEQKIQAALSILAKDKTVILIAHRLSAVTRADKIIVLKDGQIQEEGKFDELITSGGLFSSMWNDYRKSVEWKVGA